MKAAGEEGMEGVSAFEAYVHRAFAPDGLFSRARDFEYREEQQSMALAVARALQVDAPLLVEAGTGVGKSLGYLLPAVKFALDFDRKAVISTHTINLQEQLFNKDIPLLRTALGIDFSAALLKGRQNYLCHTRLRRALAQMDSLFTQGEAAELKRIQDWALRTQDGTLSDMAFRPSSKVWAMVCSEPHLNYELLRMYNPRTHKGLLKPLNNPSLFQRVQDVMDASGLFFQNARDDLGFAGSGKIVRILQPEWSQDILSQPLMELIGELKTEREKQEENAAAKDELADMAARMEEAQASLKVLMDMTEEGHVYWAERSGPDGRNMSVCSAPVEVGDILRERLFFAGRSAILTLGTGDADMSYFAGRVGAESVRKLQIGSPFNYREQMRLIVARSMPEPDQPEYAEVLPEWIKRYLAESRGRAFVLFTSYRLMVQAAEKVRPFCEEQGWTLYVQGQDMQRHAMLEAFRKDVDSVLFGTDSFWTGVDVPGESLSNVIVTRLPFEVPDHPLVESRFESIRERGGNPFYEYSVPVAILKLRQGVGRLIRTRSDSGMVVILDPRVATKRYGMRFLKSLPEARLEFV